MKKMKTHAMALILLSVMVALSGCGSSNKGADKEVSGNNVEKSRKRWKPLNLNFMRNIVAKRKPLMTLQKKR